MPPTLHTNKSKLCRKAVCLAAKQTQSLFDKSKAISKQNPIPPSANINIHFVSSLQFSHLQLSWVWRNKQKKARSGRECCRLKESCDDRDKKDVRVGLSVCRSSNSQRTPMWQSAFRLPPVESEWWLLWSNTGLHVFSVPSDDRSPPRQKTVPQTFCPTKEKVHLCKICLLLRHIRTLSKEYNEKAHSFT